MKQLTCEMCGSTDLMKQDGVFVCQSCGCKYSVEEAKKMMVEGTVDVSGSTVKVDVSDKVKNLYIMARRAKDDNNAELASKYYEMITFENPNDWEALFYFNYFKARQTTLGNMRNSVIRLANSLDSVFSLIDKSNINADEKWSIVQEIVNSIDFLCASFISWSKRHYKEFSRVISSITDLKGRAYAIADLQNLMADILEKYFSEKSSKIVASYLKSYVENYLLLDTVDRDSVNITLKYYSKELIAAEERIKKIEPEYKSLIRKNTQSQQDGNKKDNTETNNKSTNLENSNSNENTKKKRKVGIICVSIITGIVILIVVISSFGNKINSDLVGTWRSEENSSVSITFKNNGDMIVRSSSAVDDGLSYEIDGDTVTVTFANNDTETYGFVVEGNTLIFGEKYYTKVQ